jgi:uncharacterized protein YbaP (TraB family)
MVPVPRIVHCNSARHCAPRLAATGKGRLWHPVRLMAAQLSRALLLALLALLSAAACGGEAANGQRYDHGLLWRVEAPGVAPSYLYGTLHSDDERVLQLAAPVRRALAQSRRFALEMVSDEAAIRRYRAAMVTREPHLAEVLGEADFDRVDGLLAERGISPQARGRFKPWAALLVLVQPPEAAGIILDNQLLLEAERLGKPVTALENVEEQIAALDEMAPDSQLALLRRVIARQDEILLAVRPLTEAYLAGDLAAMWRVNADTMGDDPAIARHNEIFLARLLFERSERFAERLAPLLRQGGLFAVFGALHLYGERGVPALLARQGFRVRRVR